MTKKVEQYKEMYSSFLGREWGGQKGGGCFKLLFDFGIETGYHECKEDYSFNNRSFLKSIWEDEGWTSTKVSEMGEEFSVDDLEQFDLLLMNLDSNRLNHGAVYLGDGYILHHKAFDVSRIEKVKPYIGQTLYVIRKNVS
jgi:hypothetical protein